MTRRKYLDLVTIEPANDNEEVFGDAWAAHRPVAGAHAEVVDAVVVVRRYVVQVALGNFRGGGTQGVFSASQIGYDDFTVWLSPGFPTIETRVRDPCCTGFAQEGMLAMRSLTLVLRNQ
ncbi:MAG: hypothetical protein OXL35_07080, partial [Chloroflexota bacterium]|nr:hypothetical protein [Chloroflexota bacterium]